MVTRVRTLDFLPEIFKTPTNQQFLGATLDQLTQQRNTARVEGYIGSKFGYGINASDNYVVEPNKVRTDYQLDPAVVFLKKDTDTAKDFLTYPGLLDALKLQNGETTDNNVLMENQFYSWDSFVNLDKLINFGQYYWLPNGPKSVTVSAEVVYNSVNYAVTSNSNAYTFTGDDTPLPGSNPLITLMRGGTYTFEVNQASNFWIQGVPSVTGYNPAQPNVNTRDILGVTNNGAKNGLITFNVPYRNAIESYSGNIAVDLVTNLTYDQINGRRFSELGYAIDGIGGVDGKTLMFYGTDPSTKGYVGSFYNTEGFEQDDPNLSQAIITTVSATTSGTNVLTCNSTVGFDVNEAITFELNDFGTTTIGFNASSWSYDGTVITVDKPSHGLTAGTIIYTLGATADENAPYGEYVIISVTDDTFTFNVSNAPTGTAGGVMAITAGGIAAGSIYYVKDIVSSTEFTVSYTPNGTEVIVASSTGTMTATTNRGLFDDGTYEVINDVLFAITLLGDPTDPVISLRIASAIPNDINITATYGVEYAGRQFVRHSDGTIELLQYASSLLDTLYYQDGTVEGKYGTIRIVEDNDTNFINVDRDILDQKTYTSPNGVVFTNGLKVKFTGDVFPTFYQNTEFYVEGVGSAIKLVPVSALDIYGDFGRAIYAPYDIESFDVYNYELNADVPVIKDYITIARDSLDRNAWSRSNRWFHVDVINATAAYNNDPESLSVVNDVNTRANRPIIEYYSNLKLYDSGTLGKDPVDFIDFTATDALIDVAGLTSYYPDGNLEPLFTGARIVFANDTMNNNKIFVVDIEDVTDGTPVITLTEAADGEVLFDNQVVVKRGETNKGITYYYDGTNWNKAQLKYLINQYPKFDVFDDNNISYGDQSYYEGTNFIGSSLFSYAVGTGANDPVLNFPIKYSSISNLGDIAFNVDFNTDTFNYVKDGKPETLNVNTGFVHRYNTRTVYNRLLGWETAAGPSFQYQVYNLFGNLQNTYICDIIPKDASSTPWPTVQVYLNNRRLDSTQYTVTVTETTTVISLSMDLVVTTETPIEILIYSDQTSSTAYYEIPLNLNNNPFNTQITEASIGDIRGHYQSIYKNYPYFVGNSFGANNYRDLGNLIPYGTRIVQHSAPLLTPSAFLRNQDHNLFNALTYNSNEYVKFKELLMDTVRKNDYNRLQTPSYILDDALAQISSTKDESSAFFWGDMLPSRTPYITKTYTFLNARDNSIFPLSRVYDFNSANYYGVLVYLQRTLQGVVYETQLISDTDYIISSDSPSITVTKDLINGDQIVIREYNQTYGSFVPNTPSKLGLYPASDPEVILDNTLLTPAYFIRGHDGSLTKLYGAYNDGLLEDFRDKVLLEFETRIYNNLKVEKYKFPLALNIDDIIPGQFRTSQYTLEEYLRIYSYNFLNWVGKNRVDYKSQYYLQDNSFTWNYNQSTNKLDGKQINQGNWRGVYRWLYDTEYPHTKPWEMLGFPDRPTWWNGYYGAGPYTSDNTMLWNDLANGLNYNNGDPYVIESRKRPQLLDILPVDSKGNLISPFYNVVSNYDDLTFNNDWVVGDVGPAESSYLKSSSWPFDLMKLYALSKPVKFFNLFIDTDKYRYSAEFDQYLFDGRKHISPSDIQVYGTGIAKHSYINWIVDYEKQFGVDSTNAITELLNNLDVRLAYRMAGFSDKDMLKFYVEKGSPNSSNNSLLIPDESYSVLLYENQPFDNLVYSSLIVQKTKNGYSVYGNSQNIAYFKAYAPKPGSQTDTVTVAGTSVKISRDYNTTVTIVPYGTEFLSLQSLSDFISGYGRYLSDHGMAFNVIESGIKLDWTQMVSEVLYWAQSGWSIGSTVNINPAAKEITVDRGDSIVQPLTVQQKNFILNQNLVPILNKDMAITRDGTLFSAVPLNEGDTVAYFTANVSNIEHGVVFNNTTLFNDIIYNLVTGLRQQRILLKGIKTAEWNGVLDAHGFILNQDNIQDWQPNIKYTKGVIVKYQNDYWTAIRIAQPASTLNKNDWVKTDYNQIQKGLLPNPQTRAYESTLYYDINNTNLESDADLLGFSLIGYRPRDYLTAANLTDVTQVNVYRNFIKGKGTGEVSYAFNNAKLPQGDIKYDIYENWAIKSSEYAGVLNTNFAEIRLDKSKLTGNPATVGLSNGDDVDAQQVTQLYTVYNYGRQLTTSNILATIPDDQPNLLPDAGYANFDDVKIAAYNYAALSKSTTPITKLYRGDNVWLADYLGTWQMYSPVSLGLYDGTTCNGGVQVIEVVNNLNNTATVIFNTAHDLNIDEPFAIIGFDPRVDGYYTASTIVNVNSVIINVALPPSTRTLTGQGIAVHFQSLRTATGSDITQLPLINSEFVKERVWVDQAVNGTWAVYEKTPNYISTATLDVDATSTLGDAVAYIPNVGYLVSDATVGNVYQYTFNAESGTYGLYQTYSGGNTYGANITQKGNIAVISQPRNNISGNRKIEIYEIVTGNRFTKLVLQQTISAPSGLVTSWGDSVAISSDNQWMYVSSVNTNTVYALMKDINYTRTSTGYSPSTTVLTGANTFQITGNASNAIKQGYRISFGSSYNVPTYVVETAYFDSGTNKTTVTLASNLTVNGSGTIYRATTNYTTVNTLTVSGLATKDYFGTSIATNNDGSKVFVSAPFKDISDSVNNIGYTYVFDRVSQSVNVTYDSGAYDLPSYQLVWTPDQYIVTKNNIQMQPGIDYSITGSIIAMLKPVFAGDVLTINSDTFVHTQTLQSYQSIDELNSGVQFGNSVDCTVTGHDLMVGAPFDLNEGNQEGAVYRFTNEGKAYGTITGTTAVTTLGSPATILINGYPVVIPVGSPSLVASAIETAQVPNVTASVINNILYISLINKNLSIVNNKLNITVFDKAILSNLGITPYTNTQVIKSIHKTGATQFGSKVRFNERGSFIVGAPASTRYIDTRFDFSDDENNDNDTVFDNNVTQWVDPRTNGGAVYMYDYIANYNESLNNTGAYAFAQTIVDISSNVGLQPNFGKAIDFNNYVVLVGSPTCTNGGKANLYINSTNKANWAIYRQPVPAVDVNKIFDIQLFSSSTDTTLDNLDYIDPLQGKILGAARENIDVISSIDPAGYNNGQAPKQNNIVWGKEHVGFIWFDTTRTRFVNYHQNDVTYNTKYWGKVFPGSTVGVYTWIESDVLPSFYQGNGTPYDLQSYSTMYEVDSNNALVTRYYYWVRNTNTVYSKQGKTLPDNIVASYISDPQNAGITYFAGIQSDIFGLYNAGDYIKDTDTVLHIGYATGNNDDVAHNEFTLIRANYADDFLPGFPNPNTGELPYLLYHILLESLCGVDEFGSVVPDITLPKAVRTGINTRPRQSFFVDRFKALQNYFTYANIVLSQYPISEFKQASYLLASGTYYDTTQYWEYVNWWADGYSDSTKSAFEVPRVYDLSAINATDGLIVTVTANSDGKREVYIYTNNAWNRIGLETGTIQIKSSLWNYPGDKLGFGDNFFDSTAFDVYPSEETKYIVRALNEQIYTNELLIHRNKSLILLFEYIQTESLDGQNYLPWLNKTSFIDVGHTIRELLPYQKFQRDNQTFLEGYLNEVKPYHVVIKDFQFNYTGTEVYQSDVTDFDVPSTYDSSVDQFVAPQLVYRNPSDVNEFLNTDAIWNSYQYSNWFNNYGLSITGINNYAVATVKVYVKPADNSIFVDNAYGMPLSGTITIGDEIMTYSSVVRDSGLLTGITRGVNNTTVTDHYPNDKIYINLTGATVLDSGRLYIDPPKVTAYIDTSIYPAPRRPAVFLAELSNGKVYNIITLDPGEGYATQPEIVIEPSYSVKFGGILVSPSTNTINIVGSTLITGDLIYYHIGPDTTTIGGLTPDTYYYVNVLQEVNGQQTIGLYINASDALNDTHRIEITSQGTGASHMIDIRARASCITTSRPTRQSTTTIKFDRTSYRSKVTHWVAGGIYAGPFDRTASLASSNVFLYESQPFPNLTGSGGSGVTYNISNTTESTNAITMSSGNTSALSYQTPVTFNGTSGGNLLINQLYYVRSIIDSTKFTVSTMPGGDPVELTTSSVSMTIRTYPAVFNMYISVLDYYSGYGIGTGSITTSSSSTTIVGKSTSFTHQLEVGQVLRTGNLTTIGIVASITGDTELELESFAPSDALDISYSFGPRGTITTTTSSDTVVGVGTKFTLLKPGMVLSTVTNRVIGVISAINSDTNITLQDNAFIAVTSSIFNYGRGVYGVTVESSGVNYQIGDQLTISGEFINSGIDPDNNVTLVVTDIGSLGEVLGVKVLEGSPNLEGITIRRISTQGGIVDITNIDLTGDTAKLVLDYTNTTLRPGQLNGQGIEFYQVPRYYASTPYTSADPLVTGVGATFDIYTPVFSSTNVVEEYGIAVANGGSGYDDGSGINPASILYIDGATLGGISGVNDVTITVTLTGGAGEILQATIKGVPNTIVENYYIKTTSATGAELYNNSTLTNKVVLEGPAIAGTSSGTNRVTCESTNGLHENDAINFRSFTLTGLSVTNTTSTTNIVTCNSTVGINVDDEITLTGSPFGNLVANLTYYVVEVTSPTQLKLSVVQGGLPQPLTTASGTMTGVVHSQKFGNLVSSKTYYIKTIVNGTQFTVSETPGYAEVSLLSVTGTATSRIFHFHGPSVTDTMYTTVASDYIYLPPPFSFEQSLVRYANQLYLCLESNTDAVFDYSKWQQLYSDDYRLNALDRTVAYYSPTVNMPGMDLTQLFDGITFPYNTYKGNAFAPESQLPLDTILKDEPFYPSGIDIDTIIYDGTRYVAVGHNTDYTATLISDTMATWAIDKISNKVFTSGSMLFVGSPIITETESTNDTITCTSTTGLMVNDAITFTGTSFGNIIAGVTYYVLTVNGPYTFTISDTFGGDPLQLSNMTGSMTSIVNRSQPTQYYLATSNIDTALLSSFDASKWTSTTAANALGFDAVPYNILGYDPNSLSMPTAIYNAIAYGNNIYVIAGADIQSSTDSVIWNPTYTFENQYGNELMDVMYINTEYYVGFMAVGKRVVASTPDDYNTVTYTTYTAILTSSDGLNWNTVVTNNTNTFNAIAYNSSIVVIVGDNSDIMYSTNGSLWTAASISGPTITNKLNSVVYGTDRFVAVGDNGTILMSLDGQLWDQETSTSIATTNINDITFDGVKFVAVGDDNLIITSIDGIDWIDQANIKVAASPYTVTSPTFLSGYGPEEMVPGVITDNLSMIVKTNPGSPWLQTSLTAETYLNSGFKMVSTVLTPDNNNTVSFMNLVNIPTLLSVFVMDTTTNLSTRIYETDEYSIDWITETITLNASLASNEQLFVEVYELGNGVQLARTSSKHTPVRTNADNTSEMWFDTVYYTPAPYNPPVVYVNGIRLVYETDFTVAPTSENKLKIVFTELYDIATDYIVVALFAAFPNDLWYSIPETETFVYNGTSTFTVTNYEGMDNPDNAIVEVNGLRLPVTDYTFGVNEITVSSSLNNGDVVAVTTFNDTQYQYLNTETIDGVTVSSITSVTHSTPLLITTATNHGFSDNDIAYIDGCSGSSQLNNNTYVVRVVSGTSFYLYYSYDSATINDPVLGGSIGTYNGSGFVWENESFPVTQPDFDITNTDRLWVTVDGQRVNNDQLRIYNGNQLGILATIDSTSTSKSVIITSMVDGYSPNAESFRIDVDTRNNMTIYRANSNSYSWLTQPLNDIDTVIYVDDVTKIVGVNVQHKIAYIQGGIVKAGVTGDRNSIVEVVVYNNTRGIIVDPSNYTLVLENLAPVLQFTNGVSVGENLTVTVRFGNMVLINGEKIRFTTVNYTNNTVSGLIRGYDNTGMQTTHSQYSNVYSILPTNLMRSYYYDQTWNSSNYGTVGDPLQLSTTAPAEFLKVDVN